jgi:uncharacterized protein (TIGR04255 family)
MSIAEQLKPIFNSPPVIEKVMGIEFERLPQWDVPYFGLYWQQIKDNYPKFEIKPAIMSKGMQEIIFEDIPSLRCWFLHESHTKLIQIQNDRFIYNWQKPNSYDSYPHYEKIRPEFENEWLNFCNFLQNNQIDAPMVKHCDVTYVDHFERGKEWNNLSDLPDVLNCWSGIQQDFLPEPDLIAIQTSYTLLNDKGKLIIDVQPATIINGDLEILQLRITVLQKPSSSNIADVLESLDFCRDMVVKTFLGLTTSKMHTLWERRS